MIGKKILFTSEKVRKTVDIEGVIEDKILKDGNTHYLVSYQDWDLQTKKTYFEIIRPSQIYRLK